MSYRCTELFIVLSSNRPVNGRCGGRANLSAIALSQPRGSLTDSARYP